MGNRHKPAKVNRSTKTLSKESRATGGGLWRSKPGKLPWPAGRPALNLQRLRLRGSSKAP